MKNLYTWETNYLCQVVGLMKDTKQGVLVEAGLMYLLNGRVPDVQ